MEPLTIRLDDLPGAGADLLEGYQGAHGHPTGVTIILSGDGDEEMVARLGEGKAAAVAKWIIAACDLTPEDVHGDWKPWAEAMAMVEEQRRLARVKEQDQ